jgi:TonB-linked SusC/RagA family outer membrane protein
MKKIKSWINGSTIQRRLIRELLVTFLVLVISVSGVLSAPVSDDEAQQVTVRGSVTDANTGQALPGVNVVLKGTTIGTMTDIGGNYSLAVSDPNGTLVFSFIGYTPQEVAITNRTTVNVRLTEELQALSEVVVTALGIKREAKSLGYAATSVDQSLFATTTNINVGHSLTGRVAGMNVSAPPTGPGGSSKIRIRGQSSFGGDNSPLIVLNGIPIDNSVTTGSNNVDLGDGLQSINPDDIETMTVLKGASAAALYGYRAKDGVILITTKSGSGQRGLGVEITSTFKADQALDFTDFQYEYGQGENGNRPTSVADARMTGVWSFGTKFDGQPVWNVDGEQHPYLPFKDRIKAFYQTGINTTNTVAISGGDAKGGFRLSITDNNATSIVPETKYNKKILDVGINYKITEKFSIGFNANYSIENNHNPPAVGGQDYNHANTILTMANNIDPRWLKNVLVDEIGNEIVISRFTNRTNPYWTMAYRFEDINRNRLIGNINLRYQFFPWLYGQARVGQDYYSRYWDYNTPNGKASSSVPATGFSGAYQQQFRDFREINADFLIGANKQFGAFGVSASVGGNTMDNIGKTLQTSVSNFFIKDLYTIANGQTKNPTYSFSHKRVNSLYGTLDLSFREYLYVNLTARNDWFSTLNPESNSYLYPSASTSFLFSQAFRDAMPAWLDYGKIRLAYAEVGGDTSPYTNSLFYSLNANQFNGYAIGDISGSVSPNPSLRPLKVKETEVGFELIFLNRRITIDMAAYIKNTLDEILNVDISRASGYNQTKVNVGRLRNQGIEALLTLVPVQQQNFSWQTTFNYTLNKSEVLELAGGQSKIDVGSGDFTGGLSHVVGLPLAQLRGIDYKRDDQGRILTANGRFLAGDVRYFGSAIPKHIGSWLNTFTYKWFSIFGQIDFKAGHKLISNTNFNLLRHGLTQSSLVGREGGVVFEGYNADGTPNDIAVEAEAFYADYRGKYVVNPFVYDASFIRFRTLSASADLSRFVSGTFIKNLRVNANINNVFLLLNHVDNLDPESVYSSSDNMSGLESSALPTTRGYSISLNVKF